MRIVLITLGAIATSLACAQVPEPLERVRTYHLNEARYGATALVDEHQNYIWIVGGTDRGELRRSVERFNPRTDKMELVANKLLPRHYGSAAVVSDKIYVFGGWNRPVSTGEMESRVEMLDLATGKVTLVAPMPKPRAHAAAVVRDGRIYVVGGTSAGGGEPIPSGSLQVYDPAADHWSEESPMPTARNTHAVEFGGALLVLGGDTAEGATSRVELFYIRDRRWARLPDLCQSMSASCAAELGLVFFLFGDRSRPGDIVAYDTHTRTSHVIHPEFDGARHMSAVNALGRIYVIGGAIDDQGTASDLMQAFRLTEAGEAYRDSTRP